MTGIAGYPPGRHNLFKVTQMKYMKITTLTSALLLACSIVWAAEEMHEVIVYKDPLCGCCSNWVSHLKDNNFSVTAIDVDNIATYKEKYGVPAHLGSCHTAVVNGYVIEGHVPAADISRLLKEKPDILGLTVPGMPVGAPGMEMGDRIDAFEVIAISKDGSTYTYTNYPVEP